MFSVLFKGFPLERFEDGEHTVKRFEAHLKVSKSIRHLATGLDSLRFFSALVLFQIFLSESVRRTLDKLLKRVEEGQNSPRNICNN